MVAVGISGTNNCLELSDTTDVGDKLVTGTW
jgi:hypothetical protein